MQRFQFCAIPVPFRLMLKFCTITSESIISDCVYPGVVVSSNQDTRAGPPSIESLFQKAMPSDMG